MAFFIFSKNLYLLIKGIKLGMDFVEMRNKSKVNILAFLMQINISLKIFDANKNIFFPAITVLSILQSHGDNESI